MIHNKIHSIVSLQFQGQRSNRQLYIQAGTKGLVNTLSMAKPEKSSLRICELEDRTVKMEKFLEKLNIL